MSEQKFRYANETFSGCDMVATITLSHSVYNKQTGKMENKTYTEILGQLQTVSYSIHMEKRPIRSIGNVNVKDYTIGPRTIAGSIVFSVFNKHFSQDLMNSLNNTNNAGALYLVDEIPPFNITISAANEYGYRSRLVIYGIRLLNEGQVMSINDVFTENTYQYFATDIEYLSDEIVYTRSKEEKMYKLNDNLEYIKNDNKIFLNPGISLQNLIDEQNYYNNKKMQKIQLSASIKQPVRKNGKGVIDFYLEPAQDEGIIFIEDEKNEIIKLKVKADKFFNEHNAINYISTSMKSGHYNAYFISEDSNESNKIKLNIIDFENCTRTKKSTPIVEAISSNSVTISSSNKKHNKIKIWTKSDDYEIYSLKRLSSKITNLKEKQIYSVCTYNEDENDYSEFIQFETLSDRKLYKELIKYIKANSNNLIIDNEKKYISIINSNDDNDLTPADSISKAKNDYLNKYRLLEITDKNYLKKKKELEEKILICSEIINIAIQLNNDYIAANNKKNNLPAPKLFLDDNYDNIFQFKDNVTSAEFYRVYDNVVQFATSVSSCNFKTINNQSNCFRFIGKPGVKYYVQALDNQNRSLKLYFYVMSNKEKMQYINKDFHKEKLSYENIKKINSIVLNDFDNTISSIDKERAAMINIKKNMKNSIIAPNIIKTIEEVIVEVNVKNFITDNNLNFYLAIATYDDIIKNQNIYKISFNKDSDFITISPKFYGLKDNIAYAIWIENNEYKQISNASTFVYNIENNSRNKIDKYHIEKIIKDINLIAKNNLNSDIQELIIAETENNDSIDSKNLIFSVLKILLTNVIPKHNLLNFLYEFKKYIGIFANSYSLNLKNINYESNILQFNSIQEGSITIYSNKDIYNLKLEKNNLLNLTNYNEDILLLIANDNELINKSNLIVINKNEKYMEVL